MRRLVLQCVAAAPVSRRPRRLLLAWLLLLLALIGPSASGASLRDAAPAGSLDQQVSAPESYCILFQELSPLANQAIAQSFVAGRDGLLTHASLLLHNNDTGSPDAQSGFTLSLAKLSAGLPDSQHVIAAQTFSVPFGSGRWGNWVDVVFSQPPTVTQGDSYALILSRDPSASGAYSLEWYAAWKSVNPGGMGPADDLPVGDGDLLPNGAPFARPPWDPGIWHTLGQGWIVDASNNPVAVTPDLQFQTYLAAPPPARYWPNLAVSSHPFIFGGIDNSSLHFWTGMPSPVLHFTAQNLISLAASYSVISTGGATYTVTHPDLYSRIGLIDGGTTLHFTARLPATVTVRFSLTDPKSFVINLFRSAPIVSSANGVNSVAAALQQGAGATLYLGLKALIAKELSGQLSKPAFLKAASGFLIAFGANRADRKWLLDTLKVNGLVGLALWTKDVVQAAAGYAGLTRVGAAGVETMTLTAQPLG